MYLLTVKDLVNCIADLLAGGLDTTSLTIIWAIFYLANFQEVQKKLHKEICGVLPKGTLVTLEHKSRYRSIFNIFTL